MSMFDDLRKANELRKKMNEMKRAMQEKIVSYENAGLKVAVRADFSEITTFEITDPAILANKEKLERTVRENITKALHLVQKESEQLMRSQTKNLGLDGLSGMFK